MDIDRLLEPGAHRMISFANADGKWWVIPVHGMKLALAIYQPGSTKGRLLKCFLPHFWRFPFFLKLMHGSIGRFNLHQFISDACREVFESASLEWSMFGGTPSSDSKITIQCDCDNRIMGYCKVTDNPDIALRLFKHESLLLEFLNSFEDLHDRVPQALKYAKTDDDLYMFIQSTVKTLHSREVHRWTPLHQRFQSTLHNLTGTLMKAAETDTFLSIRKLYDSCDTLIPHELCDFVAESALQILTYQSDIMVNAVVTHRDFTPWNMIVSDKGLFVFDWEYGIYHGIPGLDKCHFLIQTAIFEQHASPDAIIRMLKKYEDIDSTLLKMYLLDMISLYAFRCGGQWSDSDYDTLAIRARLLGMADMLD